MRAAIVSVDYDDILSITLPYNKHHFSEMLVVTTPGSKDGDVAAAYGARVHYTTAFYDDGAEFNKWKALEEGLDKFGRYGTMCLMDADVMWPKIVPLLNYECGDLYSPHRRLWIDVTEPIPTELFWKSLPLFNDQEFAGYTQIFHANDRRLPSPPWHQIDWRHAGGADSFFQQRWDSYHKQRLPWEVLHLGPPGRNWCGRATPRADGAEVEYAARNRETLTGLLNSRYLAASRGGDPYQAERVPPHRDALAVPQRTPAS